METEALAQPLATLDCVIIALFILGSLAIGIFLAKRARSSTNDYFKGGGNMGWLMLGTSMVATAFAADTPLALTGWVVTKGISQNWFWWSMVPITMLGVFLALKAIGVLRVSAEEEQAGLDVSEHGMQAYPSDAIAGGSVTA